jgi:4-hydroxybenzoate polyprenyltransferase
VVFSLILSSLRLGTSGVQILLLAAKMPRWDLGPWVLAIMLLKMLGPISQRILTLLQLTRMALVFTAISNGACEVLLQASYDAGQNHVPFLQVLDGRKKTLIAMAAISIGLYGFGMSLNDIIDRRRDSRIAAHRPLPSGRIKLVTAYSICTCLALLAGWGGAAYARWTSPEDGSPSFVMVIITGLLIVFYDLAGKYLVPLGLLSLGMIRYLQASIAAPLLPIVWHPLLLLDHVTILSTVAYHWEQKRPPLTRKHWWTVLGGLALINFCTAGFFGWHSAEHQTLHGMLREMEFNRSLLPVAATIPCFIGIAFWIRKHNPVASEAGQKLMLCGLLWLIIYDAAFVAGYASWTAAGILLCLLPIAWWSVQLMRWWSKIYSLSQRPVYQRVRT